MDNLSDCERIQPSPADAGFLLMQTRQKVKIAVDANPSKSLYICNCYKKSVIDIPVLLFLSLYVHVYVCSSRSHHS